MTLQEQIALGESRVLEFKKELPADSLKWIKTISAFANGAGGRLLIGVDNKRNICGLPKGTDIFELKDKITDTISQMCSPQIMFDISAESIDERQLLSVQVFPGNATPYYIKSQGKENGTYIRLGATTRNADWATLSELDNRGRNIFYDAMCREYGIPEPEFMEIGDLFRVNFYRPTEKIGDNSKKSAINVGDKQILSAAKQEIGDKNGKSAIKQDSGDKITEKHKAKIIEFLKGHPESGTKEIAANVGLKISRTRDYLSILAKEGKITATGANRNRKYSAK